MNSKDFTRLLFSLPRLTPTQRAKLKYSIKALDDESGVSEMLREAKETNLICPHCGDDHVIHWGKESRSTTLPMCRMQAYIQFSYWDAPTDYVTKIAGWSLPRP